MEAQSTESKSGQNIGSSDGNNQKENECNGQAEGGGGGENEKNEKTADGMEHDAESEGESEEKSLQTIREDFEQMKAVYKYHEAKNAGKSGAYLYPQGYSSVEKRALRRYANKYLLEGKNNQYKAFHLFSILFCDMFKISFQNRVLILCRRSETGKSFMTIHCALNVTVLKA